MKVMLNIVSRRWLGAARGFRSRSGKRDVVLVNTDKKEDGGHRARPAQCRALVVATPEEQDPEATEAEVQIPAGSAAVVMES